MTTTETQSTTDRRRREPAAAAPPVIVSGRELTRTWGTGASSHRAVDGVSFDVGAGELLAIVGPSGSGKSTLGSMIAGIDQPTSGSLVVDGTRIDRLSVDELARWRGANVGIVFQNFHLIPTLTAIENVELGLRYGPRRRRRSNVAMDALATVGLSDRATRLPSQLSGGEQQRVAVARAVVGRPRLVVADEPTGSLDTASGAVVFDLIGRLAANGTTVVFITHDDHLAAAADRVISLVDGRITGTPS